MALMANLECWNRFPLKVDQWHHMHIGPASLWVIRMADEFRFALGQDEKEDLLHEYDSSAPEPCADPPADLDMGRWIFPNVPAEVIVSPTMPDRPIVVRPESPLVLSPHSTATFFMLVPLCIELKAGLREKTSMCRLPLIKMTNIWFGTPESGFLCYGLRTWARRRIESFPLTPHRFICPVTIRNQSDTELSFQRMCVRVEHLGLYRGQTRIWSNMVRLTSKGPQHSSQLDYMETAPDFEPILGQMAPPPKPLKRSIFKFSLDSLKAFLE
ncbi:MAG: DUF432 domain-containing protein [Candidatus Sumerlaeia bacterium]